MGKRQTDIGAVFFADGLNGLSPSLAKIPCPCEDRTFCGDLNIRIKSDGTWLYNDSPIERPEMVQFFAAMLKLDEDGRHWLISPTEVGRIEVDDAPFVITDVHVSGEDEKQILCLSTNVGDVVCVDKDTPITLTESPETGQLTPYVTIGDGLQAKINRAVYYELVEQGTTFEVENEPMFGLWSSGTFFPLSSIDTSDA